MRQEAPTTQSSFSTRRLGIIDLLEASGGALFTQAELHAALLKVEWAEEQNRLLKMHLTTLSGFACLLCTLLFSGLLALILSWEGSYRIPVLMMLILLFMAGTGMAWVYFQRLSRQGAKSFAATRKEIAADLAILRSKL